MKGEIAASVDLQNVLTTPSEFTHASFFCLQF